VTTMTDIEAVAAALFADQLAARPLYAAQLGYSEHLGRLPDLSDEGRAARRSRLEELGRQAAAVDDTSLDDEGIVTQQMALRYVADGLTSLDAAAEDYTVTPIPQTGPAAQILVSLPKVVLRTREDGRAYLGACRAVPAWLDEAQGRLRTGAAKGRRPVSRLVRNVVDQLDAYLALPPGDDPFVTIDAPPAVATAEWRDEVAAAVRDAVRPGFQAYRDGLLRDVLPQARDDDAVGIVNVPGGEELYARLTRQHTTTDLTVEEIHLMGVDLVAELTEEMAHLGEQVFGTNDFPTIVRRLRTDRELYFETPEEIVRSAADAMTAAQSILPRWLGVLPETPCRVIPMPPLETENGDLGHYQWPSLDGSRPGTYWINTSNPTTRPRFESRVLAFHESIPGHHTQLAGAQELAGQSDFRRHASVTAFQEGWALYTERLAEEMGLYRDDVDRLGVISFDFWRACRLVVDTGMHAMGWSRDRAVSYMLEHSALTRKNIENEVDRYIGWPGQALGYMIGRLETRRLRAEAERALGSRFDLRQFHDTVVGHGSVPLSVLGRIVGEWVDERRGAPA